jgi:hypothetical protein
LATGGARAAGRPDAADRRAHEPGRGRSGIIDPRRGARTGLGDLGWNVGRNVQIDYRWGAGDVGSVRRYAAELAELKPDVILTAGAAVVASLLQTTRTVPIVFVYVADPVGAGFVDSLARPGGNATGFTVYEYSMSGKWPVPAPEGQPPSRP